ncbi:MAG: undecaprenyl/decaprenyl-phosphate alpha-N-acetylglucosaminyl 1-phosphate transferase [Chloroflexi bacterium]|nr:undecaprenyl/decaprenyl-phosphate alpha-N-acetylglucosaminyl 1-phosphate transferase [Chloroflexota bacterium]
MTNFMLIFVAALLFAVGGTPLARRLALRLGVIDLPSERKVHTIPTPRLGGLAIYAAAMMALIIFGDRGYLSELFGILVGATLVSSLGAWDDRSGLRPSLKFAGQMLAALILIGAGVEITIFPHPLLNILTTIFWVVGITNALNLMDNMDGLSGGVAGIAAGCFLLLAVSSGQVLVGSLAAAVLGACVGFLFYNFNPASVFMGDSGTLFLGFLLAALGIKLRFPGQPVAVSWMIPVLALYLLIFDTTLVTLSRLRRGVPITQGGKDHTSHRLVALGMTRREAVLTLYVAGCILGGLALFLVNTSVWQAIGVGIGVVGITLYTVWRFEKVSF